MTTAPEFELAYSPACYEGAPYRIVFSEESDEALPAYPLSAIDNAEIEKARKECERFGEPLPIDPKTNYPAYTIYNAAGEVVAAD